jgi:hypothetical protein
LLNALKKTKADEKYTVTIISFKSGDKLTDAGNKSFASSLMKYHYAVKQIDQHEIKLMLRRGDSTANNVFNKLLPTPSVEIIDKNGYAFFTIQQLFNDTAIAPAFLSRLKK